MRKGRIGLALAALIAVSVPAFAASSLSPGVTKEDLKYIMPLSEIKIGMKGYGLTVFKGVKIEKFQVEVLGILRTWNLGRDLILVKMSGGPITERHANIMQGMSGSPVYINGRIIGAISMGMAWARDPICMITPIEDELYSLDPNLPNLPPGLSSLTSELDNPVKVNGETINRLEFRNSGLGNPGPKGTMVVTPLMTPVMVSGLSNKNMAKLADLLEPYGMIPMAGPGGKADVVPVELQAGSSVGMAVGTGDVDMTAIGTVTYRRGNKLVAFGHPFLMAGPVDAPMTTAYVYDCFPSFQTSFKMAGAMKTVGRVFRDMPFSIAGEIGPKPKLVPVNVEVNDKAINIKHTFHVDLINYPLLTPELVLVVAPQGIQNIQMIPGDVTATVHTIVIADQIGKIERTNIYSSPVGIDALATKDLTDILKITSKNKFYPLDIKSVNMSVVIEPGRKTAEIERIFVDKGHYEPGDIVDVGVEIRPYKHEKVIRTIQIKIPEGTPDGKVTLRVNGGMMSGEEPAVALSPEGDGTKVTPLPGGTAENVRQIVNKYLTREKNNELIARLLLSSPAVSINGEKFSGLPDSLAGVVKSRKTTNVKLEREEIKASIPTDFVLSGGQSMSISIEHKSSGEKASASKDEQSKSQIDSTSQVETAAQIDSTDVDDVVETDDSSVVHVATEVATPKTDSSTQASQSKQDTKTADQKTEQKTETKKDEKSECPQPEKPVARQPQVWKQDTQAEFAAGKFDGTSASTGNDIRMVQTLAKLTDLPDAYVWKVIPDGNGGVFAGTGNNGIIYQVDKDGKCKAFFKASDMEVNSLAMDSKGNVYAGTSPNGRIYRIGRDGKGEMIFDAPERYVVALISDSQDNIYAGVGDAGTIYKITPDGKTTPLAKLPNPSVLSLAVDKQDNIYAGTGKDGAVFRITPSGAVIPLYDAPESSITSLVVDGSGNIYAGTGTGNGNIYKITPTGTVKTVFDKAPKALSLAVDTQDAVYAVSDETIYKILPDKKVMTLDLRKASAQFVAVTVDSQGTIFAGASNTAAIYRSLPVTAGTYESPVHDGGLNTRWSTISWLSSVPEGTTVELQTRTGNIAEPDSTWSAWSPVYPNAFSQQIASPAARYIQYKATMKASNCDAPVLKQVSIAGLTDNRAPDVKITEPDAGSVVSKNVNIKWTGSDPDKDTLTYDLLYSCDGGKTWIPLGSDFKQVQPKETTTKQTQDPPPGGLGMKIDINGPNIPNADEMLAQIKTEMEKHPEIPSDVKQKMLAEAPAAIAQAIADAKAKQSGTAQQQSKKETSDTASATTSETSYCWDTTKVPDGVYMVKVVVSDRTSNAIGCLSDEDILGPLMVVNTPPRLTIFKSEVKITGEKTACISGYAYHNVIPIAGVQYKVDDGKWMAAAATDGMFDSISEGFTIQTKALATGKHKIEVKAIDAAGNWTSTVSDVEVK